MLSDFEFLENHLKRKKKTVPLTIVLCFIIFIIILGVSLYKNILQWKQHLDRFSTFSDTNCNSYYVQYIIRPFDIYSNSVLKILTSSLRQFTVKLQYRWQTCIFCDGNCATLTYCWSQISLNLQKSIPLYRRLETEGKYKVSHNKFKDSFHRLLDCKADKNWTMRFWTRYTAVLDFNREGIIKQ